MPNAATSPDTPAKVSTAKKRDVLGFNYRVASVTKVTPPAGAEGKNWYQYVLEGGHSPITGWRSGSLAEVTEFAQSSADELNESRAGKNVGYPRGRPAKKS